LELCGEFKIEYAAKKKEAHATTVTPWAQLVAVIEPYYPKGNRGRPPTGLEHMLQL